MTALAVARREGRDPGPVADAVARAADALPEVAASHAWPDGRVDLRLRAGALDRWLGERRIEERTFDRALGEAGLDPLAVLAPDRPPLLRRRLLAHLFTALEAHPAGRAGLDPPSTAGVQLRGPIPEDTPPATLAAVLVVGLGGVAPRETAVLDPARILAGRGPGAVRGLLEGYLRVDARVRYLGEPDPADGDPAPEGAFDDPACRRVAGLVLAFPEVVHGVTVARGGKGLVRFLDRVVPQAEALYHLPGLIPDDARITRARTRLLATARDTIWSSLRLLGARVPRNLGRGLR